MAVYQIQAPDGNTYKVQGPDGATQADVQAEVLRQNPAAATPKAAAPAAPKKSAVDNLLDTAKNVYGSFLEPAATIASGAVAAPVAGIAGLGQMANNALGIGPNKDPADVVGATQSALTYQPRTEAGQAATSLAGAPGSALGSLADKAGQGAASATRSPLYGALTNAAIQAAPMALGTKLPAAGEAANAATAADAVASAPRQAALQAAHDAGYPIPPSEVSGATTGQVAAGIGGKNDVNSSFALASQKVTNNLAKKDVGLGPNQPMSRTTLDSLEKAVGDNSYGAVRSADRTTVPLKDPQGNQIMSSSGKPMYGPAGPIKADPQFTQDIQAVGQDRANASFGTKIDDKVADLQTTYGKQQYTPNDAVSAINQLRSDARANLNAVDDPAKLSLGRAQQQTAEAIEGQVSRYLQNTGQSQLYDQFTQGRTQIAKIKTVRDAIDAGGNVNAEKILAEDPDGKVLTGGLKQIRDAAEILPKTVKDTTGVQAPAPLSALGWNMAAAGAGAMAGAGHGIGGSAISGGTTAALLALRPAARAAVLSKLYQSRMGGVTPTPGTLSTLAANPASPLAGLLPTSTSQQNGQ